MNANNQEQTSESADQNGAEESMLRREFEQRIDKSTRVVLKTGHLMMVMLFVVAFPIIKLSIIEIVDIKQRVNGILPQEGGVRPGLEQSTYRNQIPLDLGATNPSPNNNSNVTNKSGNHSELSDVFTPKQRQYTSIARNTHPSASSAVFKPCAGQPLPHFKSRINVPITFRCQNGHWRAQELPSLASVPPAWGNATADIR